MSGICGIWSAEGGRKNLSKAVQQGLEAIAHRGPDGFSLYPEGPVALGHCLLETGCNGMLVDEAGYALSFDGRLDNRDALAEALRRDDVDLAGFDRMHDKALLLVAYRHFGAALPERLRGDFAMAIWDPDREVLFLCRDHFGVRPLFYCRPAGEFHFASEIKALRAMGSVAAMTVRDAAIGGFVGGDLDTTDPTRTFYNEVFRLMPGHCAQVSAKGVKIRRYWSLDPGHAVRQANTGAIFRTLLAQAIDRRLRTTAPVGAMLSGGLDSSAIVATIGARATRAIPGSVKVFSMTFPDSLFADETPYIDAVLDRYGLDGVTVPSSGVSAFQNLDGILREQDHPPPAPNTCTFRHFLDAIAASGQARVVLHGHGGDEVVSSGTGLFFELAENWRLLSLWRLLGENADVLGPRKRNFGRLLWRKGLRGWRRRVTGWFKPRRLLGRDPVHFAPDGRRRLHEQMLHLRELAAPLFSHALEVTDHEAAAAGVEIRMPFLDVDLVSFCVTVPAAEKWVGGYPRALLRRALDGVLPPLVAFRRDKFDFADHLRQSIVAHAALVDEALGGKAGWLAPYADLPELRAQWQAVRSGDGGDGLALMRVWRAVILSRWLQLQSESRAADRRRELACAQ